MTDRERLIELKINFIENFDCGNCKPSNEKCKKCLSENEADYRLEHGVIVPQCKVGDTVYCINTFSQNDPRINKYEIDALHITSRENRRGHKKPSYALVRDINMPSLSSRIIYFEQFGKTVFLTREEAEKALKEHD